MEPEVKPASQSLTLWFNGVLGAIAVIIPQLESALPFVAAMLPGNVYPYMVAALAIGNALIRLRTSKAVTLFGK